MIHSKSNDIKLGHTAEINAHLVVENIVRLSNNEKLLSYPEGVVNNNHVPHIYCVSLGEFDGSLCFNNFIINFLLYFIYELFLYKYCIFLIYLCQFQGSNFQGLLKNHF